MIKTSRQLKDLIRNMAKETSVNAQILLRNYMMERLLERISVSEYKDKFIIKGGMLVASMVGLNVRSTMDIDATLKGANLSVSDIKVIMQDITEIPIDDNVSFVIKSVSEIMDDAEYSGIRITFDCLFDGTKTPLKVDISTGDVITPKEIIYPFKLMFEDRSIDVWAYNLETVIAEKLETVISRDVLNTRMRDFYDLYRLNALYGKTVSKDILSAALSATAEKRGTVKLMSDAEKILTEIEDNTDMQNLWDNYRGKFSYAADISWGDVCRAVRTIARDAGLNVDKPSIVKRLHEPTKENTQKKPISHQMER